MSKAFTDYERVYLYYKCSAQIGAIIGKTCDMPGFRVDHVDALVWDWVRTLMADPEALAAGLRARQDDRDKANAPLRERLAVVNDLLDQNHEKLERLIDLYVSGDFTKEALSSRKSAQENAIADLGREQARLRAQLDAEALTDEQVESITQFAQRVAKSLDTMEDTFERRRDLIDLLDVRAKLAIEDSVKTVHAECVLGEATLSVDKGSTRARARAR